VTPSGGSAARPWLWPWIAASLAAVGLMLIFHQVVRGAVLQGELRQVAAMAQADAMWRCKGVAELRDRDSCMVQLQTGVRQAALVQGHKVMP